jgi:integrase
MAAAGKKMLPYVELYIAQRVAKGKKDNGSTRSALVRFAEAWDAQSPFRPATSLDRVWVEDWFVKITTGKEPTTRRAYRSAIRTFIAWGKPKSRIGFVDDDVHEFDAGKTASRAQRPKLWLTREFFRTLWESQESPYFRGLLAFTCRTLARGGEVINVRVGDLLSDGYVKLDRPKIDDYGDRVPLLPALQDELKRYLFWYRGVAGRPLESTDYLFPRYGVYFSGEGQKTRRELVYPKQRRGPLWQTVKRLIVEAIPDMPAEQAKGIGGHTCRRSMAAEVFQAQMDHGGPDGKGNPDAMRVVQGMLGHTDVTITQMYIGLSSVRTARNSAMKDFDLFGDMKASAPVATIHKDREAWNEDGRIALVL